MKIEDSNWALNLIAVLDSQHPGLAGHFLRASHHRRQAIAAFLAIAPTEVIERNAHALHTARLDTILNGSESLISAGFNSALKRAADAVHPPKFYIELNELLTDMTDKDRRAFSHATNIDLDVIQRWKQAPTELRCAPFLAVFDGCVDFEHYLCSIETLIEAGACRSTMFKQARLARTRKQAANVFSIAVGLLEFQDPPMGISKIAEPITTVRALVRLAREYKNCAGSYVWNVLADTDYFYLFHHPCGQTSFVHLERERGNWFVSGIYGRNNSSVTPRLETEITKTFTAYGIPTMDGFRSSKWDIVQKFCRLRDL